MKIGEIYAIVDDLLVKAGITNTDCTLAKPVKDMCVIIADKPLVYNAGYLHGSRKEIKERLVKQYMYVKHKLGKSLKYVEDTAHSVWFILYTFRTEHIESEGESTGLYNGCKLEDLVELKHLSKEKIDPLAPDFTPDQQAELDTLKEKTENLKVMTGKMAKTVRAAGKDIDSHQLLILNGLFDTYNRLSDMLHGEALVLTGSFALYLQGMCELTDVRNQSTYVSLHGLQRLYAGEGCTKVPACGYRK